MPQKNDVRPRHACRWAVRTKEQSARRPKQRLLALLLLFGAALTALSCGGDGPTSSSSDVTQPNALSQTNMLRVAATVSPITSLVENIGGPRIKLEGIVPEGTNSHTFEPVPSTAKLLSEVDLFVANGLFLEEPAIEMARTNKKPAAVVLTLGDKAISRDEWVHDFSFPETGGRPNPHLWTAPNLALRYAELIRDALASLDPDNADYYAVNYGKLKDRIEELDRRIAEAVGTIPPQNRKLLTYHDSFPFFGDRYGLEIIGAVQPSDFTAPSAREVARLIDQVRAAGVPAIFGSAVFSSPVMEQIAKEGGAQFVDRLRDDDLPGEPGDSLHTYMGLMAEDVRIMVSALGGSAEALDEFDTGPVFEGESGAIYPQ